MSEKQGGGQKPPPVFLVDHAAEGLAVERRKAHPRPAAPEGISTNEAYKFNLSANAEKGKVVKPKLDPSDRVRLYLDLYFTYKE